MNAPLTSLVLKHDKDKPFLNQCMVAINAFLRRVDYGK